MRKGKIVSALILGLFLSSFQGCKKTVIFREAINPNVKFFCQHRDIGKDELKEKYKPEKIFTQMARGGPRTLGYPATSLDIDADGREDLVIPFKLINFMDSFAIVGDYKSYLNKKKSGLIQIMQHFDVDFFFQDVDADGKIEAVYTSENGVSIHKWNGTRYENFLGTENLGNRRPDIAVMFDFDGDGIYEVFEKLELHNRIPIENRHQGESLIDPMRFYTMDGGVVKKYEISNLNYGEFVNKSKEFMNYINKLWNKIWNSPKLSYAQKQNNARYLDKLVEAFNYK